MRRSASVPLVHWRSICCVPAVASLNVNPSVHASPVRLLISARDPAAAFHMSEIGRGALRDARFDVTLVAQPPAAQLLRQNGLPLQALPPVLTLEAGAGARDLLALADHVLATHRPDVILCGLSSPGEAGIDEALLAQKQIPAALVQDFWGEQNRLLGGSPDLALVLDDFARHLTTARHGTPALITGSARHAHYAGIDACLTRRARRAAHRVDADTEVWGWFGQPLQAFDGYRRTLSAWTQSLASLEANATVLYRPHPRETDTQKAWTRAQLTDAGLRVVVAENYSTEDALLACNTVCTILSNCAYDAAYLNFFSDAPLLAPVLLLFDEELRSFYQQTVDIRHLPYVEKGLTLPVWDIGQLPTVLRHAAGPEARKALWQAARKVLPDPTHAITRVLDAVWDLALAARGASGNRPA